MIVIEGPEGIDEPKRANAPDSGKPEGESGLATLNAGVISKPSAPLSVGVLEQALLARFPRADAEGWDRMGLLVGDPSQTVTGVCVALDPTRQAIRAAAQLGANVLLTHHPAFIEPPCAISPSPDVAPIPGVNVWEAVRSGVALMNFHTALDVSAEARALYQELLGLDFDRMLVAQKDDPAKGYGYAGTVRGSDRPMRLAHLAARCTSVFGRAPRVWGDFEGRVERVAFANGSAGNVVGACVESHLDCLICGEVRYHDALEAWQAGLSIVELGHDASELPLTAVLARAAVAAGVPKADVSVLDQGGNWSAPEAVRL